MERISLSKAAIILLIALAIGFSFVWRHVFAVHLLGRDYNPFVYNAKALRVVDSQEYGRYYWKPDAVAWDETYTYARYTQQVLRGDLLGNTVRTANDLLGITSGTQGHWIFFFDRLGPCLMGALAYAVGDVRRAYIVADMLFPAVLAVLLILFCLKLHSSLKFALFATALFVWFNWSDVLGLWRMVLYGQIDSEVTFLRTPLPQVSGILLLCYLCVLYSLLNKPTFRLTMLLTVIIVLNFAVYVYSWTFVVCMLCAAVTMHHAAPHATWSISRRASLFVAIALGAGSVIALPIWGPFVWASGTLNDLATTGRFGGEMSHWPDLKWTLILSLIIAPAFHPRMSEWRSRTLWIPFWIGALIVINSHMVSGRRTQPHHWVAYYFEPFFMIYCADLLWHIFPRIKTLPWMPKSRRRALWLFVILVSVLGFAQEIIRLSVAAAAQAEYNRKDRNFEELVITLDNLDKSLVILTIDPYLRELLPGYVQQRFLLPQWTDPLTNQESAALREYAARLLGYGSWTEMNGQPSVPTLAENAPRVREMTPNARQVICVKNRHGRASSRIELATTILLNEDFEVGFLR
jgi:hypothetical protein